VCAAAVCGREPPRELGVKPQSAHSSAVGWWLSRPSSSRHQFHFLDAAPAEALEIAREAADGQDVRIGGGPTVVRDFLVAGLVDHMHLVQVPIVLGRGVRIWDGLDSLEDAYNVEAVSSPSGVTHLTFTRKVPS